MLVCPIILSFAHSFDRSLFISFVRFVVFPFCMFVYLYVRSFIRLYVCLFANVHLFVCVHLFIGMFVCTFWSSFSRFYVMFGVRSFACFFVPVLIRGVISTFSWGQNFFKFFNATGLLKNWKKQHFICSNLTLFIVPFFLFSSFFSFFSLFSFFFSFSCFHFPWGVDGPPAPLK